MNDLQHLSTHTHGPVFATLNPPSPPSPSKTYSHHQYSHPVLDAAAVRLQEEMEKIQGKRGVWYAGAWMKYGFHEDGWTAGLKAAVGIIGKDTKHLHSSASKDQEGVTVYGNGSASGKGARAASIEILSAERSGAHDMFWIVCGLFFDFFEFSGLRTVVAFVLGLWLSMLRKVASVFVDLSDLVV